MGLVSMRLGRYRQQIHAHLAETLNPERPHKALLYLAALYHDIAKPATRQIDEGGRVHFLGHDQLGAEIARQRGIALCLSSAECSRLQAVVAGHLRPLHLVNTGQPPTPRAIYRFFRDLGAAGVDVCLLALADTLGTYGAALPQEVWGSTVDVIRSLLEAWWERPEQVVSPPALVSGNDVMDELGLSPGRKVGELLEAIREGQVAGQVHTREEALELARSLLT
jgi:putative nucleotidyltransferase with HDIG domain